MTSSQLDISNYWDDFAQRVEATVAGTPALSRLTLHLTEGCNLSCAYCNTAQSPQTMPSAMALQLVDQMATLGGTIHFTGGEPTVVPYLPDIISRACNTGLSVSLNTNAVRAIDVSGVNKLKVSLDTMDRTTMCALVGRNVWPDVMTNLHHYTTTVGGITSITALLSSATFRQMPKFAKQVIETFHPYNLYFTAYKGNRCEFRFSEAEIAEMFAMQIPETLQYFQSVGHDYSHRQLSIYRPRDFVDGTRFPLNETIPCYIHESEMVVSPDGYCYDCSHLYRDRASPRRVRLTSVCESFKRLKAQPLGTPISPACLTGCNPNLCAFNQEVARKKSRMTA